MFMLQDSDATSALMGADLLVRPCKAHCQLAYRCCADGQPACSALQQPPLAPVHFWRDAGHGSQRNHTHQHTCVYMRKMRAATGTNNLADLQPAYASRLTVTTVKHMTQHMQTHQQ